ncbi:response regulator [Ohtaekwangia koreensis]|uniref:histidine kinase n=1 Tax=Ohtaekwangia koreensis TaxID=688867 RepID=A0A1T5MFV7_9BACT|nr:response regulator [Ohtaekwangia koreensis]SKC87092.1 Signal transduction histidine kinase [Ohtaekwangia koreensis]
MKFLKNLSIRNKLILLIVLPFSIVLYFLQKTITTQLELRKTNIQIAQNLQATAKIGDLIHQLQHERTAAVIFSSSRSPADKEAWQQQEGQTSKTLADLQEFYHRFKNNGRDIDSLTAIIKLRSNESTQTQHNVDSINLCLLNIINDIGEAAENIDIKKQLECLQFLLYAKEFLSQIRNDLFLAASSQGFQGNGYGNFSAVKGKFDINLYKFKKYTSPALLQYVQTSYISNPSVVQTQSAIDSAFIRGFTTMTALDSKEWLANVNASVNTLYTIEAKILDTIQENINLELKTITSSLIRNSILALLVVFTLLVISLITIKEVAGSIGKMKDATERVMNGDINFKLDISTQDEMGQLATSFNQMIAVFKGYVQLADAIGKGDYHAEITVRSDLDILGKALYNMKKNLRTLSEEKETRAWLLAGNHELNNVLREEKEIHILANDIIAQIANYLKAQVGAIYLLENGHLYLTGSYALQTTTDRESFVLGQSLVGQAAQSNKYIVVEDVPEEYMKISSATSNRTPGNILVFPFMYIGKVKGVLEVGALHPFTPLALEYLQMIGNNIAIAFNSSQSRVQLKALLEETQHQAEELESQQEELRQFNDELLEKLESIEKSEADLKAQQEELQESNALLEEKANLLENEKEQLEKAKAVVEEQALEFESVSKYKSEFLANMSHELRTPLNSILILTQLLLENKNDSLTEKELKYAHVIYNSGNELLTLINDILDLSKVEAGKMDLEIDKFSFGEIVSDLSMMFAQVAKNKSIEFKIDITPGYNKIIETDKQRLVQILRNLLSNAFKFTPTGGTVSLAIHPPLANVELRAIKRTTPDVVAFSVIDTGIGIQKDKQEIIFEAFRQVDSTDKRKYGGTGLGLSICRELSGLLQGEIHLESEEGKGSTFTLYLPLIHPESTEPSIATTASAEAKTKDILPSASNLEKIYAAVEEETDDDRAILEENSRTVLIIEDDKEFAQVLLSFVRERHYKGIIAHRGITGLHYARQYKPDAILLDMKLPDVDGTEVLRQLKSDPSHRHIPIQIISGYSMKKEAMKLGAFDFVKKPVRKEDMQKVFDKLEDFANRKYKRLLVIESDPQGNQAMREMIGNGDVECIPAYSCDEAYRIMTDGTVDCVIIDLSMPDVSCFTFLEKVKSNEQLNTIPVIVYAAQDLTEEENKRLTKLANTVVLKTAYSYERLLDETTLFLHRVEAHLPQEKQNIIRKLHRSDALLEGKTALIVDDDMRNIYSLTNVLEEEGLNCLTAENGREAINVLENNPNIDIILMDVMMPEMDGYEATTAIRKSGKYNRLPIIALTAKAMKGDREKCIAAGMSDYITKPVNTRQLLSLMRVWLYK